MHRRMVAVPLLAAVVAVLPGRAADPPRDNVAEQVLKAIDRGKTFLYKQYLDTGDGRINWEVDLDSPRQHGGWTSLALLALLTAGEKPDSPVIKKGLRFLRGIRPSDTYAVGLQTMVYAEAADKDDLIRIQENADWLVKARVFSRQKEFLGWRYSGNSTSADMSCTQYALLGLYAARQAGARIDKEVWESVRAMYVKQQTANGGWAYTTDDQRATMTMTTAGVCGLIMANQAMAVDFQELQRNGVARKCGFYPEDKSLARGMDWLTRNWDLTPRHHVYYNLYGIERAGRLSGQRFVGDHDWYREGCQYLVDRQQDDGSWYFRGQGFDRWPIVSTSFALLFLSKGMTPILISKLVHSPLGNPNLDWNRKRNDLRHLTDHASKQLFQRFPLGWQIFNCRETLPTTDQDIRNLVGELLPSPIAWVTGHNAPSFTNGEKKMLQLYVEQGGFILAEACCGSSDFDAGFRRLMNELFPDNPLVEIKPTHPVWRSHAPVVPPLGFKLYGIDLGCKTVVMYSPQPISGWWEANDSMSPEGKFSFGLGTNIIAYATGLERPQARGFHVDVPATKEETTFPRGYLRIAQVKTGSSWRPAHLAIRNLMLDLRKTARMDVAVKSAELAPNDRDIIQYKLLYMHGRDRFPIGNVDLLKLNLENGATLFADACCGSREFDQAFRDLVRHMFDRPLEPIPLDDPLFGSKQDRTHIGAVRCRREGKDGVDREYKSGDPLLEGIKLGNRWAVIYSRYDIGCALEKHQSSDCLGHDHDSALRLARYVVLYTLRQ